METDSPYSPPESREAHSATPRDWLSPFVMALLVGGAGAIWIFLIWLTHGSGPLYDVVTTLPVVACGVFVLLTLTIVVAPGRLTCRHLFIGGISVGALAGFTFDFSFATAHLHMGTAIGGVGGLIGAGVSTLCLGPDGKDDPKRNGF